uniref:Uncharacterized protein n=1 Tax=viral metagenome TaxID=1070528 RepID=A0A6H1Z6N8_9ZZZZ
MVYRSRVPKPFKDTPDLLRVRKRPTRWIPAFTIRNPRIDEITRYAETEFGSTVFAEAHGATTVAVDGLGDPADWDKESVKLWRAFVAKARTCALE